MKPARLVGGSVNYQCHLAVIMMEVAVITIKARNDQSRSAGIPPGIITGGQTVGSRTKTGSDAVSQNATCRDQYPTCQAAANCCSVSLSVGTIGRRAVGHLDESVSLTMASVCVNAEGLGVAEEKIDPQRLSRKNA
jgi:hypothetical protein